MYSMLSVLCCYFYDTCKTEAQQISSLGSLGISIWFSVRTLCGAHLAVNRKVGGSSLLRANLNFNEIGT